MHKSNLANPSRISRKCRFCDEKFRSDDLKTAHERQHTGEKLPECVICNKTFTSHYSLIKHMKTIHNDVQADGETDETSIATSMII